MTTLAQTSDNNLYVYFGTASKGPGKGFSLSLFDTNTGNLSTPKLNIEAVSPAFFAIDKNGEYLYTTNEVDAMKDQPGGAISAYKIDQGTGNLTLLNQQPSGGAGPCHISLDAAGKYVFVANYNGGNFSVYSIEKDGKLGKQTAFMQHSGSSVHPQRQTKPHTHCIKSDPSNRFVLVTDLGTDKLFVYRFNQKNGSIQPNNPPYSSPAPGSGPRHFAFHTSGKWVYLLNELSSSVTVYAWENNKGQLTELQTLGTLPTDFNGTNTAAEIAVHPNGKFLYCTNRGHNSIALFSIDTNTGKIEFVERYSSQGKIPRNFCIDPSAKWMIVTNHGTNNAAVFKIDPETGKLTYTENSVTVPNPFCIQFLKK
jgi:6-phosphogluconolactonase